MERYPLVSRLRSLRWSTIIVAVANICSIPIAVYLFAFISIQCGHSKSTPFFVVAVIASIRILSMVGAGIAQEATAVSIISHQLDDSAAQAAIRQERRLKYKRWLWWTRFGMVITMLQFCGASYLMFIIIKDFSYRREISCFLVQDAYENKWRHMLVIVLLILVWLLVSMQLCIGSDILRWRSFYATHDNAWKAHYSEVFDHGIREALCCLGRIKYLSVLEEDEVYCVARLLGDLVAYRAAGNGHLELLAGLALLQKNHQSTISYEQLKEPPEDRLQGAAAFHQFAEAAYTGPLLDFGRNPVLFPCAWLYRQGIWAPWSCRRRPFLEGDNWWRGHSAAFLKYINLPSNVLRRGRVSQVRREAAYFVVVLHDLQSVVISVRGTETPEDLLTDGLCRECVLTNEDLDGLINSEHLRMDIKELVTSSFPHYGHSGIVESARELCTQVDGEPGHNEGTGFLSTLMDIGGECHGYSIRIVGHSLGGAVATLLGIMLYGRYPNLHVYAYGSLPCVDSIVAEACSEFVTRLSGYPAY